MTLNKHAGWREMPVPPDVPLGFGAVVVERLQHMAGEKGIEAIVRRLEDLGKAVKGRMHCNDLDSATALTVTNLLARLFVAIEATDDNEAVTEQLSERQSFHKPVEEARVALAGKSVEDHFNRIAGPLGDGEFRDVQSARLADIAELIAHIAPRLK